MAKKICKCAICQESFDRNSIQAVKYGARRYAHQTCYPEGELVPMEKSASEDPDLAALKEYITKIYGNKANWTLINKQIKKFHNENKYSYSGILKSLIYFYEIKHNSIEKSNGGIGIVEYCYDAAYQYYLSIFMAQNQNENKTFIQTVKEYIIKPKKNKGTKIKEIRWGEENSDEEQ